MFGHDAAMTSGDALTAKGWRSPVGFRPSLLSAELPLFFAPHHHVPGQTIQEREAGENAIEFSQGEPPGEGLRGFAEDALPVTVAVRMDAANEQVRDYYLLPALDMTWENLRVAEENGLHLDAYRFETLDYFLGMAERVKIQEAA